MKLQMKFFPARVLLVYDGWYFENVKNLNESVLSILTK